MVKIKSWGIKEFESKDSRGIEGDLKSGDSGIKVRDLGAFGKYSVEMWMPYARLAFKNMFPLPFLPTLHLNF